MAVRKSSFRKQFVGPLFDGRSCCRIRRAAMGGDLNPQSSGVDFMHIHPLLHLF